MLGVPLQIGPIRLSTNLLLAPIAGYCDLAFRRVVREAGFLGGGSGGVGLACTDLLSPQGLLRGSATSLDLARTDAADKPVGMQLYGSDPEIMAQGARWAVEHGATVVDINMGCPVDKVTKKDGGSKLLTDLPRAARIVERVTRELERCPLSPDEWDDRRGDASLARGADGARPPGSTPVPLTCKIRLCWSTADYDAGLACSPGLARSLADAGVAAVTVHGRTTEMKFSGTVRHEGIARVVEAVAGRVPVIGNGDVTTPELAVEMIQRTGCAGVMIGRGALSRPWLFRDAWALQRQIIGGGEMPTPPTEAEKVAFVRRYLGLMLEHRGEHYAMVQIRRRISWFAKELVTRDERGRPVGCRPLKETVRDASTPAEVMRALDEFEAGGLRTRPGEAIEAA
ncbi:MAG: tRNA-dihydrouridine synthase [Phycisphaerae bacterium]|nr:tRNA-dihydrouridine synthase [Phycisphaerae bacterium]